MTITRTRTRTRRSRSRTSADAERLIEQTRTAVATGTFLYALYATNGDWNNSQLMLWETCSGSSAQRVAQNVATRFHVGEPMGHHRWRVVVWTWHWPTAPDRDIMFDLDRDVEPDVIVETPAVVTTPHGHTHTDWIGTGDTRHDGSRIVLSYCGTCRAPMHALIPFGATEPGPWQLAREPLSPPERFSVWSVWKLGQAEVGTQVRSAADRPWRTILAVAQHVDGTVIVFDDGVPGLLPPNTLVQIRTRPQAEG